MKGCIVAVALLLTVVQVRGQMIYGLDISMLPEIENAGGRFRDGRGRTGDAIKIMRDHGWQLFRVRLFVDPEP